MNRFTNKAALVSMGVLLGFCLTIALNCTNAQLASDQAALTAANATIAQDQAALNAAATQPSTPQTQALITQLQAALISAQQVSTASQAAITALQQTQGQSTAGQIGAVVTAAGSALPPPWNLIALILGGVAAAVAGYQTVGKSSAQTALTTAQTDLSNHQVALAAISGSTVPLVATTTTTLTHPALATPVAVPSLVKQTVTQPAAA